MEQKERNAKCQQEYYKYKKKTDPELVVKK